MADSDRKLQVSVISPAVVGFSGEGESVLIPAHDGQLGILVGHAPMMVLLGSGDVIVKDGDTVHTIHVSGGFMQVIADDVSVLAEQVEVESETQPEG